MGASFEENAVLKARYYGARSPGLVFADDSGLEVRALGGEPGIRSARFAGEKASDQDNNRLLLARLAGCKDRSARFVCVIALAEGDRVLGTFEGAVEGVIAAAPEGEGGFGYDPLFYYPGLERTFGQLTWEEKLRVSHRGRALARMRRVLEGCGATSRTLHFSRDF